MWLLGRVLPLIVGDYVPEDDQYWKNYLQLMQIVDILFSPTTTNEQVSYLRALIHDHHEVFCKLYPGHSVIPKMNFMVHTPRLLFQYVHVLLMCSVYKIVHASFLTSYGPLVHHWTMRYEAKHSYSKRIAQSMGNYINLPYSLAIRHQHLECYNSMNASLECGNQMEVGPGKYT